MKPRFRVWTCRFGVSRYVLVHPDGWCASEASAVPSMDMAVRLAPGLAPIGKGLRVNDFVKDYKGNPLY